MNKFFSQLLEEGRINPNPVLEYVFNGATRKIYEFSGDGQGMAAGRFIELGDTIAAFEQLKCTADDLDTFLQLTHENEKKILDYKNDPDSILELVTQNQYLRKQLEVRRAYADPGTLVLTFMSFVLVEEDENPLIYNQDYNKAKITRWQKDLEVEKKIPFLGAMLPIFPSITRYSDTHFLNSLRTSNAEEFTNLQIILKKLSSNVPGSVIPQYLQYRMETLKEYENLLREALKTTTDITPTGTNEN